MLKITSHSLKFLFAAFFLTSCGGNNQEEAGPGGWGFGGFGGRGPIASVEAIPVQAATISEQVNTYGTIQAQDVVSITPQVSNRVIRILADLGDPVRAGQVLAEIQDLAYREEAEIDRREVMH